MIEEILLWYLGGGVLELSLLYTLDKVMGGKTSRRAMVISFAIWPIAFPFTVFVLGAAWVMKKMSGPLF